jgi:hypothetical protein
MRARDLLIIFEAPRCWRPALLAAALTLGVAAACAAYGQGISSAVSARKPDRSADIEENKSYSIPAAEIVGFQILLNRVDRSLYGADYGSNWSTIRRNLRSNWVADNDPFSTNQFAHPYGGSMYYGFARSAGLNFWESLGYTFAGSALWEIAGENTLPSKNDQIATGVGGSFLGESLYRMANLVLEQGEGTRLWREISAAAISPSMGFNRYVHGDRFGAILASNNPVYYSRVQVGTSATTQKQAGNTAPPARSEVLADFSMDYGLPGKPGYTYTRPFDHFSFQATASSANGLETLATRGLLLGTDYDVGDNYRGVWGLYGSYDYFAPQLFRISSTALSLGTTAQWRLSKSIALQGTGLAGVGYAAVGTLHGTNDLAYHYGVAPQALAALRLIFGDKASLDLTAREYFVSNVAGSSPGGHDNIARADLTFTWRVYRQHGIALKYLWARRDATFPGVSDLTQTRGTIGIYYVLLGHERFGTVDW